MRKFKESALRICVYVCFMVVYVTMTTTVAFFVDDDYAGNRLIVGSTYVEIYEDGWKGGNVVPGEFTIKNPAMYNMGTMSVYVRVRVLQSTSLVPVTYYYQSSDGLVLSFSTEDLYNNFENYAEYADEYGFIRLGNNWYYCVEDGYFYYNAILPPETYSLTLFDGFIIDRTVPATLKFDIYLSMEAVQASGLDKLEGYDFSYVYYYPRVDAKNSFEFLNDYVNYPLGS